MIRLLTTEAELQEYDEWLRHHPAGNFWQSLERRSYVHATGKQTKLYGVKRDGTFVATALVVIDTTIGGLSTWEIPRGPLWTEHCPPETLEHLLKQIVDDAKAAKCMALYLSSPTPLGVAVKGLRVSDRFIHCEATRIIDLTVSEEEILRQMKPKGRYNIRVAENHGILAEESDDINGFIALMKTTAQRDGFEALPPDKYRAFYKHIQDSFLLMTYHPEKPAEPIGGLLGVLWEGRGIYYYGASDYAHRALMTPYRLQWLAMRYCKEKGAQTYDLLGIAPPDAGPNHPWHGISEFKEKFGGTVVTYPKEQMIVLRPVAYGLLRAKRKLFG